MTAATAFRRSASTRSARIAKGACSSAERACWSCSGGLVAHYSSTESRADNSIRTIRETRDGAVWIGTIAGLRRLDRGVRGNPFAAPRLVDSTNISVLCESRSGDLWIGTYGRGLMRFENGRLVTLSAPVSLPHNNVLAVFEDAEENVWVGTQGGMLRLQPGAANTITTTDGAPLSINTIYQDPRGPVLVVALNGRLFQVARQTLVPVALPAALAGLVIRNVFRDSKGRLVDRHRRPGHRAARRRRRLVALHDEGRARQRLRAGLLRRP